MHHDTNPYAPPGTHFEQLPTSKLPRARGHWLAAVLLGTLAGSFGGTAGGFAFMAVVGGTFASRDGRNIVAGMFYLGILGAFIGLLLGLMPGALVGLLNRFSRRRHWSAYALATMVGMAASGVACWWYISSLTAPDERLPLRCGLLSVSGVTAALVACRATLRRAGIEASNVRETS